MSTTIPLVHAWDNQKVEQTPGLFAIGDGSIPPRWQPLPKEYDPRALPTPFARAEATRLVLVHADEVPEHPLIRQFSLLLLGVVSGVLQVEPQDLSSKSFHDLGQALLRVEAEARYFSRLLARDGERVTPFGSTSRGALFWGHARRLPEEWDMLAASVQPREKQALAVLASWRESLRRAGRWDKTLAPWQRGVDLVLGETAADPALQDLHADTRWVGPVRLELPTGQPDEPVRLEPVYLPVLAPGHAELFVRLCTFQPRPGAEAIEFLDGRGSCVGRIQMPSAAADGDLLMMGMGVVDMPPGNVPKVPPSAPKLWVDGPGGLIEQLQPLRLALERGRRPVVAAQVELSPALYPDPVRILVHQGYWRGAADTSDSDRFSGRAYLLLSSRGVRLPDSSAVEAQGGVRVAVETGDNPRCAVLMDRAGEVEVLDLRALGQVLWRVFLGEAECSPEVRGNIVDAATLEELLVHTAEHPLEPRARVYEAVSGPAPLPLRKRLATLQRFVTSYSGGGTSLDRALERSVKAFSTWASGLQDVAPIGRKGERSVAYKLPTGLEVRLARDGVAGGLRGDDREEGLMSTMECGRCGFDVKSLPATIRVESKDGGGKSISCPLCGSSVALRVEDFGILVRGTGANTSYARWKLSAKDEASNVVRLGRLGLRFDSLGTIEPREVCYPRTPVFVDEGGNLVVPTIPIRTTFFDCIDEPRMREALRRGPIGELVGSQYQVLLPLRGLKEPVRLSVPTYTPEAGPPGRENAIKGVNVRIWPNVNVSEWKYYLAGIAGCEPSGDALVAERRLRASVRVRGGTEWLEIDNAQRGGASRVRQLDSRPAWIAMEWLSGAREGEDAAAAAGGIFPVPEATEPATAESRFGLDFGTSNTCVAVDGYMTQKGLEPELLPAVAEPQWNLYLVRGGPEARVIGGADAWPAPSGFGKGGDLVPSELAFTRTRREVAASLGRIESWRFGVDFGLTAAGVTPQFSEAEHLLGDFKWRDMLLRSAPPFAPHIEALQAHYLTAVLMWAYVRAAISSRQGAASVTVLYSYPMAFSTSDMTTLADASAQATEMLRRLTGIEWRLSQGVDESTAAARNAGETDANVLVYLDMGGGSTDIAIKIERSANRWETVYLTSVAYAGGALLEAYASNGDPRTSCLMGRTTVDVLRRKVRESRNARDILGDGSLFNRAFERVVERRTRHFYGYLVEYVARLIAAGLLDQRLREMRDGRPQFPSRLNFGFFFLGNGWSFASQTADDVSSVLSEMIFLRAITLFKGEKSPYAADVKKLLRGVEVTHSVGKLQKVAHPKAAVALGVLRAVGVSGSAEGEPRSGILGWPTRVGDKELPWFLRYTTAGSAGPVPPGTKAGAAGGGGKKTVVLLGDDDDDESAPTEDGTVPSKWYVPLSAAERLDWTSSPPGLPETLEQPFDLDQGLNGTRGVLRTRCQINGAGFFDRGAYEVMLEHLFKPRLVEIA